MAAPIHLRLLQGLLSTRIRSRLKLALENVSTGNTVEIVSSRGLAWSGTIEKNGNARKVDIIVSPTHNVDFMPEGWTSEDEVVTVTVTNDASEESEEVYLVDIN